VTLLILRKSDGKTFSNRMWHVVIGNASSQAAVGVHECHPRTSPSNTDLALVIDGPLSYLKFTTHKSFDVASAALTRGLKSNAQLLASISATNASLNHLVPAKRFCLGSSQHQVSPNMQSSRNTCGFFTLSHLFEVRTRYRLKPWSIRSRRESGGYGWPNSGCRVWWETGKTALLYISNYKQTSWLLLVVFTHYSPRPI